MVADKLELGDIVSGCIYKRSDLEKRGLVLSDDRGSEGCPIYTRGNRAYEILQISSDDLFVRKVFPYNNKQ